jgi:hypothetical protein
MRRIPLVSAITDGAAASRTTDPRHHPVIPPRAFGQGSVGRGREIPAPAPGRQPVRLEGHRPARTDNVALTDLSEPGLARRSLARVMARTSHHRLGGSGTRSER